MEGCLQHRVLPATPRRTAGTGSPTPTWSTDGAAGDSIPYLGSGKSGGWPQTEFTAIWNWISWLSSHLWLYAANLRQQCVSHYWARKEEWWTQWIKTSSSHLLLLSLPWAQSLMYWLWQHVHTAILAIKLSKWRETGRVAQGEVKKTAKQGELKTREKGESSMPPLHPWAITSGQTPHSS